MKANIAAAMWGLVIAMAAPPAFSDDRQEELQKALETVQQALDARQAGPEKAQASGLLAHARLGLMTGQLDIAEQKIKEAAKLLGVEVLGEKSARQRDTATLTEGQNSQAPPTRRASGLAALNSPFGLEYGMPAMPLHKFPHVAQFFAKTGASWIKFQGISWDEIEPKAPGANGHDYRWQGLDAMVKAWQGADFHIQMHLTARSPWGGAGPCAALAAHPEHHLLKKNLLDPQSPWRAASAPKKEHRDDYRDWILALVERYDGDGQEDMPGLKMPIRHWEIESEAQHVPFWIGSAEDYKDLLVLASKTIRQADPEAKVIVSGIHLGEFVKDNPDLSTLGLRVKKLTANEPSKFKKFLAERVVEFIAMLLKLYEHYDIIEFHSLGRADEIPGTVAFLKAQMKRQGVEREIWVGDATSAPEVGDLSPLDEIAPLISAEDRKRYKAALANPKALEHEAVKTWYRREQAVMSVQKAVFALESGATRIFLGALEDWYSPLLPINPWPFHGLADGYQTPRPAFEAFRRLVEALPGVHSGKRLSGLPEGVVAVRFMVGEQEKIIAWYDDGALQGPGADGADKEARLPWSRPMARVTDLIEPKPDSTVHAVKATGGTVKLTLSERPILID